MAIKNFKTLERDKIRYRRLGLGTLSQNKKDYFISITKAFGLRKRNAAAILRIFGFTTISRSTHNGLTSSYLYQSDVASVAQLIDEFYRNSTVYPYTSKQLRLINNSENFLFGNISQEFLIEESRIIISRGGAYMYRIFT